MKKPRSSWNVSCSTTSTSGMEVRWTCSFIPSLLCRPSPGPLPGTLPALPTTVAARRPRRPRARCRARPGWRHRGTLVLGTRDGAQLATGPTRVEHRTCPVEARCMAEVDEVVGPPAGARHEGMDGARQVERVGGRPDLIDHDRQRRRCNPVGRRDDLVREVAAGRPEEPGRAYDPQALGAGVRR